MSKAVILDPVSARPAALWRAEGDDRGFWSFLLVGGWVRFLLWFKKSGSFSDASPSRKSGKIRGGDKEVSRCPVGATDPSEGEPDPEDEEPEEEVDEEDELELMDEETEEDLEEIAEDAPRRGGGWSSQSGAEDMELIRDFLEGDEKAFTRLVIKYQNKIHNLCFRIMGDRDEAMDMAQEVFLSVHRSLKEFRGDSLFSTWIFRVAVNHCKNRIKYLGRRHYYHSVSLDQPRPGEGEENELYHEVEDEGPNAFDLLNSEEIQKLVQEAIASLDPDHRIVIILRDINDLSYEEIAEIVGIKLGTVKSRINRARNDLKRILESKIK